MRELFDAYLKRTPDEFGRLWEECEFTVDANVLLGIYNASKSLRSDFFAVIDGFKDRVFSLTKQDLNTIGIDLKS